MKLKIYQKAYELDLSKLSEGYLSSETIVHTENRNQARHLILEKVKMREIGLRFFLNDGSVDCYDPVHYETQFIKTEESYIIDNDYGEWTTR